MTLQPADLDRLEQLAREATPGPWVAQSRDDGRGEPWYVDSHHWQDGPYPVVPSPGTAYRLAAKDAAYIAALDPATVSELVAAARLGAAWQEAEAALPEGMSLAGVRERRPLAESERWEASAKSTFKVANPRGALYEYGPTPAAALLALAEALRERP